MVKKSDLEKDFIFTLAPQNEKKKKKVNESKDYLLKRYTIETRTFKMERIQTRNERLCYCQKSTASLLPFILPPSHNDREISELTGRNKTQMAKAAEKRLAYKINGKRKERTNLETKNQADYKSGNPSILNLQFKQPLNKKPVIRKSSNLSLSSLDKRIKMQANTLDDAHVKKEVNPSTLKASTRQGMGTNLPKIINNTTKMLPVTKKFAHSKINDNSDSFY